MNEARKFVEQDQRMLDELEDELHGLGASWAEIEIINSEHALQEKTLIRQLGASDKLREQRWQAALQGDICDSFTIGPTRRITAAEGRRESCSALCSTNCKRKPAIWTGSAGCSRS